MKNFRLLLVLGLAAATSCGEKESPEAALAFTQPPHFPKPTYDFTTNPISRPTFELGKALFYDEMLSRDNSISCASCHQQGAAFVHADHDVSHGIDDLLGTRNAPPVINMAWNPLFFWDGGVHNLDLVSIAPIENPVEMDETLENVLAKLNKSNKYQQMFNAAYGTPEINSARMLKAMSQFMLMLVSANSRYDKYVLGDKSVLNSQEINGLNLVKSKCTPCHSSELFSDFSFRNNGLALRGNPPDEGRKHITLLSSDLYKFKVPSLRNVAITAPYMHDGRFQTLENVLNHYTTGVQNTANLDNLLVRSDGTRGISLSAQEQQDIIAFLQTLTDESFIRDPRFTP
jgi:cytochrome c peroxidase